MGVTCVSEEIKSPITPSRLFKALVIDAHNLIPKISPLVKSIVFVEGNGGAGSIKKITFAEGAHMKWLKQRTDALDTENLVNKYTLIECDPPFDKIEKIVYEAKFEASGDGSICKIKSKYHSKEGVEINENEIKGGKEKAAALHKAIEDYLQANPDYASIISWPLSYPLYISSL